MLGIKGRNFKTHSQLSLDTLVPEKHFYRQLEATLNLSFVRELVRDFYLPYGRPSIDPVVFFKLQLIMLFEGIRSERQLLEHVQLNLAFRWYIGYDLDESVPDHSSLTKIRERYGLSVFRRFFQAILQRCFDAGLVWDKELYFDGTRVEANAAMSSHVSNFEYELAHHLNVLFPNT
jgi:transposase